MANIRHPARLTGMLALAVPVLAGIAWMAFAGAPSSYPLVNGIALLAASAWVLFGRAPRSLHVQRALVAFLAVVLFVPLASGPELQSVTHGAVARWLPLGPLHLHAGMLVVPALAVFATREAELAPPILLAALLGAYLQPDAATGFAITLAAVGLHHVTRDWKIGVVAIVAFFASILMALSGELTPQPFVEYVLPMLARSQPAIALALVGALVASYFLILKALPAPAAARFTLAGSLFGFAMTAVISSYPTPLIGYGASAILGYGLALGLLNEPTR